MSHLGHSRHFHHPGVSGWPRERTFGHGHVYEYTPLGSELAGDTARHPFVPAPELLRRGLRRQFRHARPRRKPAGLVSSHRFAGSRFTLRRGKSAAAEIGAVGTPGRLRLRSE